MKTSTIAIFICFLASGAAFAQPCDWTLNTNSISEACGNVTIGAAAGTSPQKLVVWDGPSNDAAAIFSGDGALSGILLDARATNGRRWGLFANASAGTEAGSGKFSIRDQTSGLTRLVIDSAGRVGIGTVTPDALLTLGGDLRFRLANNASVPIIDLDFNGYTGADAARNGANYRVDLRAGQPMHQWWTRSAGSPLPGGTEYARMVLTEAGNLGIGTVSPDALVTVGGAERFRLANNSVARLIDLDFNAYVGANAAASGANYRVDLRDGQPTHQWWVRPAAAGLPAGLEYARMVLDANGNLGVGTTAPAYRLDVSGNSRVVGDLIVTGNLAAKYQDVAEWVPATNDLAPATVVVLNPNAINEVMPSHRAYDTRVAGVVSAQPGLILGEAGPSKEQIATTGRVRVLVDATRAPVAVGDLLVTSDTPGAAMKSEAVTIGGIEMHRPGTIIGKALEPLVSGKKEILVLLSLQ